MALPVFGGISGSKKTTLNINEKQYLDGMHGGLAAQTKTLALA